MIVLKKDGDCVDCPGIDLEVVTLYADGEKLQNVVCKNEKLCRRLKKMMEEREGQQET